jgi:hypothetical protein
MWQALFRRVGLRNFAALALCLIAPAQGAVLTGALQQGGDQVPHFGHGKVAVCVSRTRERLKAIMNGTNAARFEHQPPGSNRGCL